MRLRNSADIRSLVWVALAIGLVAIQYSDPSWVVYLCPLSCYLAVSLGTVAHNHNHRPTFQDRRWNNAFGHILTFFYGYPTLMWVPTHNLNHHRFVNRPGDATATWRYTNKHNLWVALTYPFVSGYFQRIPIKHYIDRAKRKKPSLYSRIRFQYVFWIVSYVGTGALAGYLYHSQQTGLGLYLWFFSVVLPGFLSTTVIMVFNYIQHVHTDAYSDHDHSRNFTGKWFNFLFFNNGYHTAHHNDPAMHWSQLPAAHKAIEHTIEPTLNERNLIWFAVRQYFISPLFPKLATRQIGEEPEPMSEEDMESAASYKTTKVHVSGAENVVSPVAVTSLESTADTTAAP